MEKTQISEDQAKRMQRIQLDILSEIDRICEKYGIKYCLGFGTMLGAVRHQGFIPWDDDADVLMLRDDYELFKKACAVELEAKYFLQDEKSDKNYLWGYAKLRNLNTIYIRSGQEHILCANGVYVDIFPLDNVPNCFALQVIQDFICTILRKTLWAKVGQYIEEKRFTRCIYKILARVPKKKIYQILYFVKGMSNKQTERVRCLLFTAPGKHWNKKGNSRLTRYGFEREWVLERKRYTFEDRSFWGSKDYQHCLYYLYGDYMKLPSIEKRVGNAPVSSIDLKGEGLNSGGHTAGN